MGKLVMNKDMSEDNNIELDKNIRDSGIQGGKILGEKLALCSFIIGIPFLIIGLYALCNMLFGFRFPMNKVDIIAAFLVLVIGLLLIIGGYSIHRAKYVKN